MAAAGDLNACEIFGVLVPGDGRVRFCRANCDDLQIGDWVELNGAAGSEPAYIVFGPGQVDYSDAPADLPRIQRRLTQDEIAELHAVPPPEPQPEVRYGSLGRLRPRTNDLDAHVRIRLGLDPPGDQPISARMPHLGSIVRTAHGPGILLAVSMRHQSATIRLDSGEEVRVPVGDLG